MSQPADVRCSLGTCLRGLARRVHTCCRYVGPRCNTAGRPAVPPALALATGHPSCCAHQPVKQHATLDRDATGKAWLFIHASFIRHTGVPPGLRYEGTRYASFIRQNWFFPWEKVQRVQGVVSTAKWAEVQRKVSSGPCWRVVGTRAVCGGQGAFPDAGCNS